MLRTPCLWSGKVLAKVQRPLDIGNGGENNKNRANASSYFLCICVGRKGQKLNEISSARHLTYVTLSLQ